MVSLPKKPSEIQEEGPSCNQQISNNLQKDSILKFYPGHV
jgi:hypothetical protein